MRRHVRETIVVEGRYDKHAVLAAVDALVVETGGFGVFNDREKTELLRKMAHKNGLIILTDSDGAGFLIRGHLKGKLPPNLVKHAYIPDISGKERRKVSPSREGTLGVEGMTREVIVDALAKAGATFDGDAADRRAPLSRTLLVELGLSGGERSSARRDAIKTELGLPKKMSAPALFEVLGALITEDELRTMCSRL